MQNNEDKNWNEHIEDIASRQWKNDFASLSNKEVTFLIRNVFYQLFLIDVDDITIESSQNEFGSTVRISIEGEPFRDADTLSMDEILDYFQGVEFSEEEDDEEEDD